jgi:uncharacterized protein YutE (UPF0331/DUF86 family)
MGEAQLDLLERLLNRIEHYAATVTRAELEADLDAWLKVTGALELAAQCSIRFAMEMVARRGLGLPESNRDAFVRLAQAGLLSTEQANALGGWAGLRNVLAHLYGSIDLDRLYSALREDKTVLRELGRVAAHELAS